MKKIVFMLTLLANCAFAQIKNGDLVPDLYFATILNAEIKTATLNQLKGKVVVIEFWATWCGSCIAAMPHLSELQEAYPGKLKVITVTRETSKRIRQFLDVKPSRLWFAIDTAQQISTVFPHQWLPHTVLISPDGKLVANTDPEAITKDVIERILKRETVALEEKKDSKLTPEELINLNFYAADTVTSRFMMQPDIKGAPGFRTTYANDSSFQGRRLTVLNCSLSNLYRLAFDDFPDNRTINKMGEADKNAGYCFDLIVPDKSELLPRLKKELAKKFDGHAEIRRELRDVYLLTVADPEKFKRIPVNTSGKRRYYVKHGEIDEQAATMADLAEDLETFGVWNLPVLDETRNAQRYDLRISFRPEDPSNLKEVLTGMGLALKKGKRKVDMLYLW